MPWPAYWNRLRCPGKVNLTRLSFSLLALVFLVGISQQWASADGAQWWRYCAALIVAGLAYEWLNTRHAGLVASCENDHALRLGRTETLLLKLSNPGPRPRSLEFVPGLPLQIESDERPRTLPLASAEDTVIELRLSGTDIGTFLWPRLPARIRGPLGLAWWPCKLSIDTQLQVIPDLVGNRQQAAGRIQVGDRAARPGRGMELHHLREYVPGDPRHTIDWKATARSQQLITRVFSEEQHLEIMLVLDVGRTSRTRVDGISQFAHYINLASRFAQYAAANGDDVGLVAAADTPRVVIPPQRGAQAVSQIHAALRTLQPQATETDILGAALRVQQLASRRCLVIVLTDLYGQTLDGSFGRSLKLWNSRHLPCVVGLVGNDVIELAEREAIGSNDPYISLAGSEYRNTLLANAEAARRLGAQAIVARPEELQERVLAQYRMLKQQRRV